MKTMAITAAALLFSLLTAAVSPAQSEALPATFITVNGNGGAPGVEVGGWYPAYFSNLTVTTL